MAPGESVTQTQVARVYRVRENAPGRAFAIIRHRRLPWAARNETAIGSIVALLDLVHARLEAAGVAHALIGAFAMAACGVPRATNDVDFLIDGAKATEARQALESAGFSVFHASEEVLQMSGPGPVDFLLARRPLSLAMLARASGKAFRGIGCVQAEDLIGLKIQAYKNDPRRELQDRADIQRLIEVSPALDWARIKQYADLFSEWPAVEDLRRRAGRDGS
jgi:hypothetical protein